MKRGMRFLSFLLVFSFLLSNGFSFITNPVFAASPMKKEKFLIKHADNEKLKEKFIYPYIFEKPQITTEDSITVDKSIDSEILVPDIDTEPETKAETDGLDIVFESITEEISIVEATHGGQGDRYLVPDSTKWYQING